MADYETIYNFGPAIMRRCRDSETPDRMVTIFDDMIYLELRVGDDTEWLRKLHIAVAAIARMTKIPFDKVMMNHIWNYPHDTVTASIKRVWEIDV